MSRSFLFVALTAAAATAAYAPEAGAPVASASEGAKPAAGEAEAGSGVTKNSAAPQNPLDVYLAALPVTGDVERARAEAVSFWLVEQELLYRPSRNELDKRINFYLGDPEGLAQHLMTGEDERWCGSMAQFGYNRAMRISPSMLSSHIEWLGKLTEIGPTDSNFDIANKLSYMNAQSEFVTISDQDRERWRQAAAVVLSHAEITDPNPQDAEAVMRRAKTHTLMLSDPRCTRQAPVAAETPAEAPDLGVP